MVQTAFLETFGNLCKVCVGSPQIEKNLRLRDYGELSQGERAALRFYLQALASDLLPEWRVRDCLRKMIPACAGVQPVVEVVFSEEAQRASLRNLQTCAGVWVCPVCSARISEGRREEIGAAVTAATAQGLSAVLITYTVRHHAGDKIGDLLNRFLEALRKMRSGWAYQQFKKKHPVVGQIRGLEATYGDAHGWHPHAHELMFLQGDYANAERVEAFRADLWLLYSSALRGFELDAVEEWGLDVRSDAVEIAEYVAKHGYEPVRSKRWGVGHEIAKAASKVGQRAGRKTPFQLLADNGDGDERAGVLFQQFARAYKGKSQVRWSRGLHKRLAVEVESDQELAAADDPVLRILASLTASQWQVVLLNDIRVELIKVAQSGDMAVVWEWLDSVPGMAAMSPFYDDNLRKNQAGAHMLRVGDGVAWFGKTTRGARRRFLGQVVAVDGVRVKVGWLEDFRFKQWLPGAAVWRAAR
ncbi:MAG: protein rep [Anaerolineae bacterium]|nr:protein rep [Anaerolineae bacterium]